MGRENLRNREKNREEGKHIGENIKLEKPFKMEIGIIILTTLFFVLYIHEMAVLRREEDFLFDEEIHGACKNLTIDSIYSFYVLRPLKFKLI